jgi:hypothetical protein
MGLLKELKKAAVKEVIGSVIKPKPVSSSVAKKAKKAAIVTGAAGLIVSVGQYLI